MVLDDIDKMKSSLRELTVNFSLDNFMALMDYLDTRIMNSHMTFDEEFLYYFSNIMNMVNDKYIVEGKHQTLGNKLITSMLEQHKKLTPTLVAYLYLDKKRELGLSEEYNQINFGMLGNGAFMAITEQTKNLSIDWKMLSKTQDVDEYNYHVMQKVLHELTHVYQLTRNENSTDPFEVATFYDAQITKVLSTFIDTESNPIAHESLLTEQMADEMSMTYLLDFAKTHPNYFNEEIISRKEKEYIARKKSEMYRKPRTNFHNFLREIENIYISRGKQSEFIPMIQQVMELETKQQSSLKALMEQGISEDTITDCYYNIYNNCLYNIGVNGLEMFQPEKKKDNVFF